MPLESCPSYYYGFLNDNACIPIAFEVKENSEISHIMVSRDHLFGYCVQATTAAHMMENEVQTCECFSYHAKLKC